jgi:hypothetical protein
MTEKSGHLFVINVTVSKERWEGHGSEPIAVPFALMSFVVKTFPFGANVAPPSHV